MFVVFVQSGGWPSCGGGGADGWQNRGLGSGIASSDLISCLGVCTPRGSELKSEWGRAVCVGVGVGVGPWRASCCCIEEEEIVEVLGKESCGCNGGGG